MSLFLNIFEHLFLFEHLPVRSNATTSSGYGLIITGCKLHPEQVNTPTCKDKDENQQKDSDQ